MRKIDKVAKEREYRSLRRWIEVTGIVSVGCSYEYEMRSIIDDAFAAGKKAQRESDKAKSP